MTCLPAFSPLTMDTRPCLNMTCFHTFTCIGSCKTRQNKNTFIHITGAKPDKNRTHVHHSTHAVGAKPGKNKEYLHNFTAAAGIKNAKTGLSCTPSSTLLVQTPQMNKEYISPNPIKNQPAFRLLHKTMSVQNNLRASRKNKNNFCLLWLWTT